LPGLRTFQFTSTPTINAPPHFHVVGPDIDVQVAIETLQVIRGRFKGTALAEAMAWAAENRTLLLAKWSEFNERD
jgi:hypothetical protein